MKILLTAPDLDAASGGPSVVVTRFAAELVALGHSVALVFMAPRPGDSELLLPPETEIVRLPRLRNPWQRFRQFRMATGDLIDGWGAQLVHDHGLWLPENAAAASAAHRAACPFLSQPCGMLQDWPFSNQRLKKTLAWHGYQHRLLSRAAAVVVTSAKEQQETTSRLGSPELLRLIPHGVDLPELPMSRPPRLRRAVFLGRLDPKKQVDLLLRAWIKLRPQGWQLALAGGGDADYVAELKLMAQQGGIADQVKFLGPVHGEAKSLLLAGSQLFLQPSLHENFGLSVAEALAHELPALTTTAMPWMDLEAVGGGWSVNPDESSVTHGLSLALKLPAETLATMGLQARKLVSRYCWTETAKQTLAIYAAVTGRSD